MATANKNPISDAKKAQENFREILGKFDQAMLVTHSSQSGLRARPMAIAEITEDGSVWFITGVDSTKVNEALQDPNIMAVMQSSAKYLSVTGQAVLHRDRAHIERLWKEPYKAWFSGGKDDPTIALIQLKPSEAEYWDNSGMSGLKFALQYAKAYVTGKEMQSTDDVNQHAKVQL
ncbi:MAG TPA: pyridoxamine 5'-phosphate oxidase family protein [Polyangiales bacterium]|nr:pyridoxamine 5'-phosphate oxidase family protein [Polyangiales bacterium]